MTTTSSSSSGSQSGVNQLLADNVEGLRVAVYKGITVIVKPIKVAVFFTAADYNELMIVRTAVSTSAITATSVIVPWRRISAALRDYVCVFF